MTTQATTQRAKGPSKRRMALLVSLVAGAALASVVALAGTARQADAALAEKIVFMSDRTTGKNVNNPTGDYEIFTMNPDGTGVKQLTANKTDEYDPTLSPDGTRIAYESYGVQTSNPEGDGEVYRMSALDGTGKKNLTNNGTGVSDFLPVFSPDGTRIAYESYGIQTSNPDGGLDIYSMSAADGTGKKNLSNSGAQVYDNVSDFSADGKKIVYTSAGTQTSNPEGDFDIYSMNTLDGKGKSNLTDNKVAYDAFFYD